MSHTDQKSVVIVGAGIAGLMAAGRLSRAGWRVTVIDKGRGLGGRMANRRIGEARFDHGAQFFTTRDRRFSGYVSKWVANGQATVWYDRETSAPDSPPLRHYVGSPAMTAIGKQLAEGLNPVLGRRVTGLVSNGEGWTVADDTGSTYEGRWVVLTAPVPQALDLIDRNGVELPASDRTELDVIEYEKCIAVMVTLSGPSGLPEPGLLRPDTTEPLALVADNQRKGVSPVSAVTLHSGPRFAESHFDAPDREKIAVLLKAAEPFLRSPATQAQAHRWGFAKPFQVHPEDHYCCPGIRIALAGDGFGGGRVEGAALSGLAAADSLFAHEKPTPQSPHEDPSI